MRDFEVFDIVDEQSRFLVTIEFLDNRDRKQYGYPKGNGWENELNGEPKWLRNIKQRLEEMDERALEDLSGMKAKYVGARVSFDGEKLKTVLPKGRG